MNAEEQEGRAPRYLQLGNLLRRRIEEGTYRVGSLLPTEAELCAEFAVSRYTVREALRQLITAGLVTRRQGSGTQVVAAAVHGNYVHSMRSLSELFQYAADTTFRIASMEMRLPDAEFIGHLGEEAGEDWLRVSGIRLDQDGLTSICYSVILINRDFAAVADTLEHHEGAIYGLIEKRFGVAVADVVQEISAAPISKVAAKALGESARIWSVRVIRRYLSAEGRLLLMSVNDHPGDRFSYTMHLRREAGRGFA